MRPLRVPAATRRQPFEPRQSLSMAKTGSACGRQIRSGYDKEPGLIGACADHALSRLCPTLSTGVRRNAPDPCDGRLCLKGHRRRRLVATCPVPGLQGATALSVLRTPSVSQERFDPGQPKPGLRPSLSHYPANRRDQAAPCLPFRFRRLQCQAFRLFLPQSNVGRRFLG